MIANSSMGEQQLDLWTSDRSAPSIWTREVVDWTVDPGNAVGLRIDPANGLPSIAYFRKIHSSPAVSLVRRLP